jgi:protein-S-isoprenylcysteine O-methyltransferase Ste14
MFWAVSTNLVELARRLLGAWTDFGAWFHGLHQLIFLVDVAFGCIGYFVTLRFVGSHIRSTNPFWSSWLVCLVCYPPFWPAIHDRLIEFDRGPGMYDYLTGSGAPFYLWALAVIGLELLYVWATVIFGLRFSNLTNRGILTNGPYRWFKHPAYLAKNASWWLWYLPFLPFLGWGEAAWSTAQLVAINLLYLARARTEEWHLREEAAYLAYEDWIRQHGALALMRRAVTAPLRRAPSMVR